MIFNDWMMMMMMVVSPLKLNCCFYGLHCDFSWVKIEIKMREENVFVCIPSDSSSDSLFSLVCNFEVELSLFWFWFDGDGVDDDYDAVFFLWSMVFVTR